ncbi:MAG: efflux RND transporter periplasmic adaptor subunit [Gammaproteobacteria bacterium]
MNELIRTHRFALAAVVGLVIAALAFGLGRLSAERNAAPTQSTPAATQAAADTLKVAGESLSLMGIAVEPATTGDLSAEIDATGVVSATPSGQASVTAHGAGTIARIAKRLGESVKAGEPLAFVSSREAAAMAAERRSAGSKVQLARSALKRERELFEQGVTPRQDLELAEAQAAAAEADAERARIAAEGAYVSADGQWLGVVSPIAGRITAVNASLGAYVEPDTELFRVADPRVVVVEAAIPSADVSRVRVGDPAQIKVANGIVLTASVIGLTPTLNTQTGAATATLALADGQAAPPPGEFVQARIAPRGAAGADIVVTDEAVQVVGGRDVVFVRTDEGFRIQPVMVMARSGGRVAIRSGLKAGEQVATRNAFLLKAEATRSTEEEE